MGFWSKAGKFAVKTAVGILAPGALAGYEYRKQKETAEMLQEFNEAISDLFKEFAQLEDEDAWSEFLVVVRGFVVEVLGNEESRTSLLKMIHPNEKARACCSLVATCCEEPTIEQLAETKGVSSALLVGLVCIIEMVCKELDASISNATLPQMEEAVMRMLFDTFCTKNAGFVMTTYIQNDKNATATFQSLLTGIIFSDDNEELTKAFTAICEANKVSYETLKRKMLNA